MDIDVLVTEAFSAVSLEELKRMIDQYESLPVDLLDERAALLESILFHRGKDGFVPRFIASRRTYPPGTNFFRIRTDSGINKEELSVRDFWEPPTGGSKGRLNLVQERLLYIADRPGVAWAEVKMDSAPFSNCLLTVYRSTKSIQVTEVGFHNTEKSKEFEAFKEKTDLIEEFIARCFLGSDSDEFVYDISNLIAKDFLDFSLDGWCYASAVSAGGESFCLRLAAKEKLNFVAGLKFQTSGIVVRLFTQEGGNIVSYAELENDQSAGAKKAREIDALVKTPPDHDSLTSEERKDTPIYLMKMRVF